MLDAEKLKKDRTTVLWPMWFYPETLISSDCWLLERHKTVVFCKHDLKIQTTDALTLRGHEASWVTSSKEAGLKEKAFLVAANETRLTACPGLQRVSVSRLSPAERGGSGTERCAAAGGAPGPAPIRAGERGKEFSQRPETKLHCAHCLNEHIRPAL